MFSKVEATGELTFKLISCMESHQYLSWKLPECAKYSLGAHQAVVIPEIIKTEMRCALWPRGNKNR